MMQDLSPRPIAAQESMTAGALRERIEHHLVFSIGKTPLNDWQLALSHATAKGSLAALDGIFEKSSPCGCNASRTSCGWVGRKGVGNRRRCACRFRPGTFRAMPRLRLCNPETRPAMVGESSP